MLRGIHYAEESDFRGVTVDSQVTSMPFYRSLNFIEVSDVFEDAGIPHMRMSITLR